MSVFTLAAAACGGDDDDDAGTGDTEAVEGTDAVSTDTEATDRVRGDDGHRRSVGHRRAGHDRRGRRRRDARHLAGREPRHRGRRRARPGRRSRVRHRGRHRQPVRAVQDELRDGRLRAADVDLGSACSRRRPTATSRRCSSSPTSRTPTTPSGRSRSATASAFHDDTPLDGAAVEFNMETCQYSPLTGAALTTIKDISSSGQTVTITTNGPYVAVPRSLHRAAVRLHDVADVARQPRRRRRSATPELPVYDAELAATPADGDRISSPSDSARSRSTRTRRATATRSRPCATRTTGVARTASPARPCRTSTRSRPSPAVDIDSRSNALRSGQFDIIHSVELRLASPSSSTTVEFETIASSLFGDTNYTMLNVAEGPDDPDGRQRRQPAAERPLPAGAGVRDGQRAPRR